MRDYIRDLKQCIKRLYFAEEMLDKYLKSAGQEKGFFDSLDLDGFKPEYKHPIKDYVLSELIPFVKFTGEPLRLPKDFTLQSPEEVRKMIVKRRDHLRKIAGMLDKSRWLGEKNYLCYKTRKKRYWTGRLIG